MSGGVLARNRRRHGRALLIRIRVLSEAADDRSRSGTEHAMKAVIQRVSEARLTVGERLVSEIDRGLVVLFCVEQADEEAAIAPFARKVAKLRIFADEDGKMNRSILDIGGSALVVSQFTLAGDTRKGNRPSFIGAAPPERADRLYRAFCAELDELGVPVQTGEFGAEMKVALVNDGPVTIWLDSTAP